MDQTEQDITKSEARTPDLTPLISMEDMLKHFENTTPEIFRGPHKHVMRLPTKEEMLMDGTELTKILRMP